MKGPTEPGSGMCRKTSAKEASSAELRLLPKPIAVTLGRAAGPPFSSMSAFSEASISR